MSKFQEESYSGFKTSRGGNIFRMFVPGQGLGHISSDHFHLSELRGEGITSCEPIENNCSPFVRKKKIYPSPIIQSVDY